MRIGLYGGTFDPLHLGHLLVAQAACEELSLNRLVFIPAAQSPFKPELRPTLAEQRLQCLRLGLAGHAEYEIDEQEIRRGGVSFTIDTVRDYTRRFPRAELFYLIGADHLPLLHKWREAQELAEAICFVAIPRPGQPAIAPAPPFRVQVLRGFPIAISSSEIRRRVAAGKSIRHLVPAAVAEAIVNNRLYFSA